VAVAFVVLLDGEEMLEFVFGEKFVTTFNCDAWLRDNDDERVDDDDG